MLSSVAALVLQGLLTVATSSAAAAEAPTARSTAESTAKTTDTTTTIDRALAAAIDGILASEPRLARATISVAVGDPRSGALLYAHNPDTGVNPASNVKLVTTAIALRLLGPEHRYVTQLFADPSSLRGDTLDSDLYLKGSGDPWLVTGDLYELVGDLQARGIRRITGGIVVDATAFDRDELPPAFDQKDEFAAYRAMTSAAAVNFNTFVVQVRPGAAIGEAAIATLSPPVPGISLHSEVTTTAGRRDRVTVDREPTKPTAKTGLSLTLRGEIGVSADPARYRFPVPDPTAHAGAVLLQVLGDRGIKVSKREIQGAATPKGAQLLATHASPPLSTICRALNKLSNNFMAEQVLKSLDSAGAPATSNGALDRVRAELAGLGISGGELRLGNGSGLYDANRVSAGDLVALLIAVYNDFTISADFLATLPLSGADGTLRRRLRGDATQRYVRAKTGTLNEASALSGYAGAAGTPPLAFAILIGDIDRGKTTLARRVQDRIAEAVVEAAARR